LTSKRRIEDHEPGLPAASLARARHHIVAVGSVLVVNCEAVTVWFTVSGAVNLSEVAIWIV
jgi:hypothetical protein